MILAIMLAIAAGGLLAFVVHRPVPHNELPGQPGGTLEQLIEHRLAGEGCGACDFDSCAAYAAAIAARTAPVDRCLLGGHDCARAIERLLREHDALVDQSSAAARAA